MLLEIKMHGTEVTFNQIYGLQLLFARPKLNSGISPASSGFLGLWLLLQATIAPNAEEQHNTPPATSAYRIEESFLGPRPSGSVHSGRVDARVMADSSNAGPAN
jgi:hypothetical protein